MALNPRDIPITREQVAGWVAEWEGNPQSTIEEFLLTKLDEAGVGNPAVDTTANFSLGPSTPLLDLIMSDIGSYGG